MSAKEPDNFETPTDSKRARLTVKGESCPANLESRARPVLGTPLNSTTFASSGRPYRLSKNQRAQIRQRRLEFQTANTENPEKTATNKATAPRDPASFSKEELIELIKRAENELSARNTHAQKVKELQESIATWKRGFNEVLGDFQSKLQAKENKYFSKQLILQQLHVPLDVVKYLEDVDD